MARLTKKAVKTPLSAEAQLLVDLRPHVKALSVSDDDPEYKGLLERLDAAIAKSKWTAEQSSARTRSRSLREKIALQIADDISNSPKFKGYHRHLDPRLEAAHFMTDDIAKKAVEAIEGKR